MFFITKRQHNNKNSLFAMSDNTPKSTGLGCSQNSKIRLNFKWLTYLFLLASMLVFKSVFAASLPAIQINGNEDGVSLGDNFVVWYDPEAKYSHHQVASFYEQGEFFPLETMGSTGLKPGAIWSRFSLENTTDEKITLHLEYIDHQVIGLKAFEQKQEKVSGFTNVADLALYRPFEERQFAHNRFVFEITLDARQTSDILVQFSSDGMGFVFPDLRVWSPELLRNSQSMEASGISFLLGGFFLMSIIALIAGIATGEKFFYAYAVYDLSKIAAWATILGYTHQFIITDSFHWSYMSLTGALSIFCGLLFARMFLQTKIHTPRLDYILLFMMANALFLFVCAIFKITSLSVISITIALLLYPVLSVVGLIRWRQGSKEAAVFALAWTFLVIGLVIQALRDLGFVEHNMLNYYWPPIASYTEMMVIMAAMGLKVRRLRLQKEAAELKYTAHLENSKTELENQVLERTRDLIKEKSKAEQEARTDWLTGTHNRRSFFNESERILSESREVKEPCSYSLLMFDIDHFKQINDNYGHSIGDQALKRFAATIMSKIREQDVFGRLGGEEFSLLVCDTRENALQLAERLREDISQLIIETPLGAVKLTTSIGVAHLIEESKIDDLLSQADRALYEAKKQGRNKVVDSTL